MEECSPVHRFPDGMLSSFYSKHMLVDVSHPPVDKSSSSHSDMLVTVRVVESRQVRAGVETAVDGAQKLWVNDRLPQTDN